MLNANAFSVKYVLILSFLWFEMLAENVGPMFMEAVK